MTSQLRFPAEWEPQSAVLLAWPHEGTDWAERLGEVEETYIALVAAIVRFQRAVICVADDDVQAYARARLSSARIEMDRVAFIEVPYDDTWLRDSGPITLLRNPSPQLAGGEGVRLRATGSRTDERHCASAMAGARSEVPLRPSSGQAPADEGGFCLLDFRFTGWGGKFEASLDDQLIEALNSKRVFRDADTQAIDFALEGGAIDTDGDGTLLTTWQCLHERHPDKSREDLTAKLSTWLAQQRVLWLDHGYLEGDDTDAHIDTLARFAAPDAIVFQACDDPVDSHYAELKAMADEIAALRTPEGRPYRLFPLPWPKPIVDGDRRLAASYANFLIINGAVLMPAYGDPADAAAVAVLATAFPDREIVPVPCRPLIWQNGSLHCITMQLPEGVV